MFSPTDRTITRRSLLAGAASLGAAGTLSWPVRALGRERASGDFPLISSTSPAAILVDAGADSAVLRVADSFTRDLERVSGNTPRRFTRWEEARGPVVIIGVAGQSRAIDALVAAGKLDTSDLHGEWEAYRQAVVANPFPGVPAALVIVGSDRRGAVFGTYDISERIGVSPWHWFADVPVRRRMDVSIPNQDRRDQPKVRYRGFFINDEAPCFSGWAQAKFGGANSALYAHVFELLLRMKGNYLWPAMWAPRAFAADDPQSMILADAMGVVMGNSHHEVMLRAQDEWHRHTDQGVTGGAWDYTTNAKNLRTFWRGGIERMMSKGDGKGYESVVTIGMRGDGDEAMAEGTATDLLERIVADQRAIIADVTGKPADKTPQIWALYKEVQDYYDHGMRVPDDVTLLFSDDNWGQIRRLPKLGATPRSGGQGVYYHFDYVGAPRNYKWINTNQIEKVWQQMSLAYARDARAMWLVNVGDIKPMEYPLGFFLKQAWDPEAMTPDALAAYPARWAEATFGAEQAEAIGALVTDYSKYVARRKPELTNETSFALGGVTPGGLDGGEFGDMVGDWEALEKRMLKVRERLSPDQLSAYYQLVEYPVAAMTNLYRMYYATAWNRRLAASNDPRANYFADQVERTFARDGELVRRYHSINGGKWDGMMAQVHMNYVIWNAPTEQPMPPVMRVGADTPESARGAGPSFVPRPAPPEGVIAIEAPAFIRAASGKGLQWTAIENLGRTRGAVVALPQGREATTPADNIRLDYAVDVARAGPATLTLYLAPTLDVSGASGVRIGVSLDNGPVQTLISALEPTSGPEDTPARKRWVRAVSDNIVELTADLGPVTAGSHTIKIWRIDDNVVLEKLVLATVPVPPSYLGPRPASEART